jgi:hypothetical protein
VRRVESLERRSRVSSSVTAGNGSVPSFGGTAALAFLALSSLLVREPARLRCVSWFHPSAPNEPLLISFNDGAFDTVAPVAAHIPAGGVASMSFMLAVRILLDVVEASVDVLLRCAFVGESVGALGLRMSSGCGNRSSERAIGVFCVKYASAKYL